jgi:hypothetical protein
MILKNWSLALITAAVVAPLSAGALGVSIESTSVAGGGNVNALENGDVVTFDLLLENATQQDVFALGVGVYGYDEGSLGSAADNHLVFVSSTGSASAFNTGGVVVPDTIGVIASAFNNGGIVVPGTVVLNNGDGLTNSTVAGVESGAPFPFNQELRAVLFNGIGVAAATGTGNDDEGVGGGLTGVGSDVHIQVSFLVQGLNATYASPGAVTLEFGTGRFGNEAVGTGGSTLAFNNATSNLTVVPEPGTALLMGLGLAGLTSIRRR